MSRVLLDTNLLLYAIDEDSKYFKNVTNFLNDDLFDFYITSKNISEFLSVVTRIPDKGINIQEALTVIEEFKSEFTVLYPTEKSHSIFLDLLKKYSPHGLKIHDFEIVSISLAHKVKNIATLNTKDFTGIEEIKLVSIQ